MNTPNWKNAQQTLIEASIAAIRDFVTEHPHVQCCHFAFDSEPRYGYVQISFDTAENSQKSAQAREIDAIERREQMLSDEDSWINASYFLTKPVLVPFGDNTGDFEFQGYREVRFPNWQEFAESPEYPQQQENEDDFLEGHFRIVIWRVVESLIAKQAFHPLKKSSPFLISYALHDQEQSIVRMLNWPQLGEP